MRFVFALIACLLTACGAPLHPEVARVANVILFEQDWPVNKTNSGISAAGNVDFVPWGVTARDSDYPNIGLTDEVKIVSNLLDANSSYVNAGVVADRGLGPVVGNGNYPTWIDADRRLLYYADYQITTASLAATVFAPVLGLHVTAGGSRLIQLNISPDGSDWKAEISSELWNEGDIVDDSTVIPNADLENKRIRFLFDLTPGTMDAPGDNVEDDGTLIVSMIDLDTDVETVLYSFTNRSFYLSWVGRALGGGSTVPQNNALAVMAVGYAGLIGQNERFGIMEPSTDPELGSLIDHSEPCCDAHEPGVGGNAGPVVEPLATTWEPTIEGGGGIDDPIAIADDEDWTDQPKEPDAWLTITEQPYPATSPSTVTTKWGLKPYSDPGRLVDARLREVGAIERGSSDKHGNYSPARARFVADDADGTFRERLGDDARRHLLNREAKYELISYDGRKAGLDPAPIIQGRIVDVQPATERQAVVEVQDIVGSHFGILNPEKMIGPPIGDEHENLPDETRGHIYNILLGQHFDIPARDCGDYDFDTSPQSGPITYLGPPLNLTGELIGAGSGSRTYHYAVVGVTNLGTTTPMSNIVSVSGCPDALDVDTYVELNWDPPATGADQIVAYFVLGRTASTPNKRLDTMNNGGTFVNPETTYRDGRQGSRTDFDREKSVNFNPQKPSTATVSTTVWTWFAVALGEVPILKVYGSDIKEGGVPERVELDINFGDILTPESDGWPESDPYRVVGGIRQSGFWARGTRVQHHRDGIVTFTCDTGGWKGTNDLMINQAFLMLYRFLNDAVEKDGGLGYRDGDFGPCETFADGRPKFHISKFLEAQNLSAQLMERAGSPANTGSPDHGSPGLGFIGKIFVIEPTPLGEVLRRFFESFGGHMTSHRCGAMYPFLIDPTTDAASGPIYRERREIQKVITHELNWREQENRITYDFQYSPDQDLFGRLNNTLADDDSIAAHGGENVGIFETDVKKCYFGSDADTMAARWQMELDLYAYPPRYVTWTTDLTHVQRDNGDEVRFMHRKEGLGIAGEDGTPGVLMAMTYREQPKQLEMRVRLLTPVLRDPDAEVALVTLVADDNGDTLVADDNGDTLVEG